MLDGGGGLFRSSELKTTTIGDTLETERRVKVFLAGFLNDEVTG